MDEISIDRLTLLVPGLSPSDGRRLAFLVASGLESIGAAGSRREIPRIRLDLVAGADASPEELSRQIVAAISRQILFQP